MKSTIKPSDLERVLRGIKGLAYIERSVPYRLAQKLDASQDRIIAMRTAIGGLSDPSAYANNVKPSGV
jgi:hypothetical protein